MLGLLIHNLVFKPVFIVIFAGKGLFVPEATITVARLDVKKICAKIASQMSQISCKIMATVI